jgi:hypothetical protein
MIKPGVVCLMALLVLVLLAALGRLFYPDLETRFAEGSIPSIVLTVDSDCDPALTVCRVQHGDLALTLRLQDEFRALQPFWVQVNLAGSKAAIDKVAVRFAMVDMDMGVNRFILERQDDGIWKGQAMLPVCSSGRRDWRVTVELAGNPPYAVEFSTLVDG